MAATGTAEPGPNFQSRISEFTAVLSNIQSLENHYNGETNTLKEKQKKTETARSDLEKKATNIIASSEGLIKQLEAEDKILRELEENRGTLLEKHVTNVNNFSDGRFKLTEYQHNAVSLKRQIATQDTRISGLNEEVKQMNEQKSMIEKEQGKLKQEMSQIEKVKSSETLLNETTNSFKQSEKDIESGYTSIDDIEKQMKTNQEQLEKFIQEERELKIQKEDLEKKVEQVEEFIKKSNRGELEPEEIKQIETTSKRLQEKIGEINGKINKVTNEINEKKTKLENFENQEKTDESQRRKLEKEIYKLEDHLKTEKDHLELLPEKRIVLEGIFNMHDGKVKEFKSKLIGQKETLEAFKEEKERLEKLQSEYSADEPETGKGTTENDDKKEMKTLFELIQNRRKIQINHTKAIKEENQIKHYLDKVILEENVAKSEMEAATIAVERLKHLEAGWKRLEGSYESFAKTAAEEIRNAEKTLNDAQGKYEAQKVMVKNIEQIHDAAQKQTQKFADEVSNVLTAISQLQSKLETDSKNLNKSKIKENKSNRISEILFELNTDLTIINLQLEWINEEIKTTEENFKHHEKERSTRENQIKKLQEDLTKTQKEVDQCPSNIRENERKIDDLVEKLSETIGESSQLKLELEILFEESEALERSKGNVINEQKTLERKKNFRNETSKNLEEYKKQLVDLGKDLSNVKQNVTKLKETKRNVPNKLQQAKSQLTKRQQKHRDARFEFHSVNRKQNAFNQSLQLINERLDEFQINFERIDKQSIERGKQIDQMIISREKLSKAMEDEQKGSDEKSKVISTASPNLTTASVEISNEEKKIEEQEKIFNGIQEQFNQCQAEYRENSALKADNYQRLEFIATNLAVIQRLLKESQREQAELFNEILGIGNIYEGTEISSN